MAAEKVSGGGPQLAPRAPIKVFVASPIGSPGTPQYADAITTLNYVIRKALPEPQWRVVRADDDMSPDSIGQAVVRHLIQSDLVVVDLTGHNPNVFYELAIAHSFKTPVVLIAKKNTTVPFDVVDQRTIFYDLTEPESVYAAQERLLAAAEFAVANPTELVNPVSTFERASDIGHRIQDGDEGQLVSVLSSLSDRMARIESQVSRGFPPVGSALLRPRASSSKSETSGRKLLRDELETLGLESGNVTNWETVERLLSERHAQGQRMRDIINSRDLYPTDSKQYQLLTKELDWLENEAARQTLDALREVVS